MSNQADQNMVGKVFNAISWTAAGGAFQFFLSLLLFAGIALYLSPETLGVWGVCVLLVGFAEMLGVKPFSEVLQQRKDLSKTHINTSFSVSFTLSIIMAAGLIAAPYLVAHDLLHKAAPYLSVLALMLPVGACNHTLHALLARDLKFAAAAKVSMLATILSGAAAITGLALGAGLWALVMGDAARRLTRLIGFYLASRVFLHFTINWSALRQMTRFNRDSFATYVLGYLDGEAPKWFAAIFLGAEGLGHFVLAERAIGLLRKLVLSPFASVTMAAVARVQTDANALRHLIASLYRGAALIGYPAFIGAAVIVTDVAALSGDKWIAAALAAQIMLLSGIRTTTGAFNVAILRGTGRTGAPIILIFSGVIAYLILLPLLGGTVTGLALCVLLRSFLTWPLGMVMIKQASGLSLLRQASAGSIALLCSVMMGASVWGGAYMVDQPATLAKIILLALLGVVAYGFYIFLLDRQQISAFMRVIQRKSVDQKEPA